MRSRRLWWRIPISRIDVTASDPPKVRVAGGPELCVLDTADDMGYLYYVCRPGYYWAALPFFRLAQSYRIAKSASLHILKVWKLASFPLCTVPEWTDIPLVRRILRIEDAA